MVLAFVFLKIGNSLFYAVARLLMLNKRVAVIFYILQPPVPQQKRLNKLATAVLPWKSKLPGLFPIKNVKIFCFGNKGDIFLLVPQQFFRLVFL